MSRGDDLDVQVAARVADLELDPAFVQVYDLVFLAVELKAQLLALADVEDLPAVPGGRCVDDLVAPGLLDPLDLLREPIEVEEIRGKLFHGCVPTAPEEASQALFPCSACGRNHSGCSRTYFSASRRSFGVFTVIHKPSCRWARSLPSPASSGNVVAS